MIFFSFSAFKAQNVQVHLKTFWRYMQEQMSGLGQPQVHLVMSLDKIEESWRQIVCDSPCPLPQRNKLPEQQLSYSLIQTVLNTAWFKRHNQELLKTLFGTHKMTSWLLNTYSFLEDVVRAPSSAHTQNASFHHQDQGGSWARIRSNPPILSYHVSMAFFLIQHLLGCYKSLTIFQSPSFPQIFQCVWTGVDPPEYTPLAFSPTSLGSVSDVSRLKSQR